MAAYAHFFTIGSGLHLGLEGWSRSTCVTRPNRVHLRYGSHVRSAGLRLHRLLRAPPALLPAERAINRVSTLQDTRSARLVLALQTHTNYFPCGPAAAHALRGKLSQGKYSQSLRDLINLKLVSYV